MLMCMLMCLLTCNVHAHMHACAAAGGRYTIMFLYFAKAGVDDVFTPAALQQMCEVENVVLGEPDYGKVCFNSSSVSTSTYAPSQSPACMPTCYL